MSIDLTQMQPGETGIVEEIQGGHGLVRRLQSIGVRSGKKITKVSSHFWRGPQTIDIDNTQIAIGFGMARRILVEAEGVPVVSTCGLTGEGIKELISRLPEAKALKAPVSSDGQKWEKIGRIVEEVQRLTHWHHTLLEILENLSIKPLTGLPIAIGIVYCAFWVVRFIGENLIGYLFEPLFERLWLPSFSGHHG